MDDKTTLEELLKLELHKFEDEVKNIVDKAVKEMAMEKVLRELQTTWSQMEFEKEPHDRTRLFVLRINEETIDTLEEHQVINDPAGSSISLSLCLLTSLKCLKVQLQNMLGSKFIGHFLKEVSDWQQKLSNADAVISVWFEVQRAWMHLESIFIGSEDIRSQLPEDSKRFEKIDREFKVRLVCSERYDS